MRLWKNLACRLWHPRDYWHNRHFDRRYRAVETEPGCWSVAWKGQLIPCRPLTDLEQIPHPPVCHIIASGPSWAQVRRPGRLFDDFTICMNGSYRVAKEAGRKCDLYISFDAGFIRRRHNDFIEGIRNTRHLLIDQLMFALLLDQNPELGMQANPFLYDDPNRPYLSRPALRAATIMRKFRVGDDFVTNPKNGQLLISKSPRIGLASNTSVVCLALQAAWLMGFKEVRIYGMDLGGPARFYQEAGKSEPTRLDSVYEDFLLPWFKAFTANLCGPSFRVFNCSESSRLPAEIIPKRDPNAD